MIIVAILVLIVVLAVMVACSEDAPDWLRTTIVMVPAVIGVGVGVTGVYFIVTRVMTGHP